MVVVIPVAAAIAGGAQVAGGLASMVGAGAGALSSMASAIAGLYGVGAKLNDFLNQHIQDMQASANPTIAKTGQILEMAKFGFGLGYLSSVTIIAVGQVILGNPLSVVSTVATAATMTNPIAMTCGAIGAVVYGWNALSDEEKNAKLDMLSHGLEVGVELIKAIIQFVIRTAQELLNSQLLKDLKSYIADKAALFGRSLSDVTHLTVDLITDAASTVKKHAEVAIDGTVKVAGEATDKVGETLSDLGRSAGQVLAQTGSAAKQALAEGKNVIQRKRGKQSSK